MIVTIPKRSVGRYLYPSNVNLFIPSGYPTNVHLINTDALSYFLGRSFISLC
ncbi:MAG: hypothetical protein ACTS6G_00430 [Candidatus Hodgkinia cicadicola]